MFPITTPISPETIAFLSATSDADSEYEASILKARNYHEGVQFVQLTTRLREFLGGDTSNTDADHDRLRLNVTRIVTSAVVERLLVNNFDSDETGAAVAQPDALGNAQPSIVKPVADWAWQVWRANKMDAKQRRVHEATVRDSESFVIVDWDAVGGKPRFTPHLRYVDASATFGSNADVGEGCRAFYANDDPDQELLFVTKRWMEVSYGPGGTRTQRNRLTVYLPHEIRKYAGYPGAWERVQDATDTAWPIPWLHKDGSPLGIPVIHFTSGDMEAREAWPAQNAINFLCVLEMTAADMTAFRILIALGWEPVDEDGNDLIIAPGRWLGTKNKDGKVQDIPPADISPISNLVEGWVYRAAMVTDTPVSRFITTKQVSAEGSQKQMDAPLVSKIKNRQGEIGNGWESCMDMARRLENTYGAGGLDEAVALYTGWASAETRDEDAEIARAQKLIAIGIPFTEVATDTLGYDMAKVTMWDEARQAEKEAEREAMAKQAQAGGFGGNGKAPMNGKVVA